MLCVLAAAAARTRSALAGAAAVAARDTAAEEELLGAPRIEYPLGVALALLAAANAAARAHGDVWLAPRGALADAGGDAVGLGGAAAWLAHALLPAAALAGALGGAAAARALAPWPDGALDAAEADGARQTALADAAPAVFGVAAVLAALCAALLGITLTARDSGGARACLSAYHIV